MTGWIKLHRKIWDHWLWDTKESFDKRAAWIDLLMLVNHAPRKVNIGMELVEVRVGEHITSLRKLASRWGWSSSKVRRFLELLEDDGMLTVNSDTKKTVVRVVNYPKYQGKNEDANPANGTSRNSDGTRAEHDQDTDEMRTDTNNNVENGAKNTREEGATGDLPSSVDENQLPNVTSEEREILQALKDIPDWPFDYDKDLEHIRDVATEYPKVDLAEQVKFFGSKLIDKPLNKETPRLQLRRWIKNGDKFGQHKPEKRHNPLEKQWAEMRKRGYDI